MLTNALTPVDGLLIILAFGLVMISVTLWVTRGRERTKKEFLLANRGVGVVAGAMSIGASWIWAPAMFVSSQKTYQQGLAGLFWYIVPNIGTLIIFGPFAARLRTLLPDGYTLPQYMRKRHGKNVQVLYLIVFFSVQICSLAVQILAASALLAKTTGISSHLAGALIVVVPLTYAMIGGLRASVVTDYLQMIAMIVICCLTVPWAVHNAGGYKTIISGMGGVTGQYTNPLDPWVFYTFGISITIGLLSGPLADQMQWQRAYALQKNGRVRLTFFLGALVFASVPLSLCNLGFIAANNNVSGQWHITDPQMVGPIAIANLLPHYMLILFLFLVVIGLSSTIDSSLCAIASLVATDVIATNGDESTRDTHQRRIYWLAMVGGVAAGYAVAQIPGLKVLHLFLFYGTMRASTMIPTILTLTWRKLNSKAIFPTVLISFMLGGPLMIVGNLYDNIHLTVLGSLSVVCIGATGCILGSKVSRA